MSVSNHTKSESRKVIDVLCSIGSTADISYQLTGLVIFNVFLTFIATAGNTVILVALNKVSSLHPQSKLLFRNLAVTDLCVGVLVQPIYIAYVIVSLTENWKICRYALVSCFLLGSILGAASLSTLSAISMDRLLAMLLRLKYRHVVTLRRTKMLVFIIWVLALVCGGTQYFLSYIIDQFRYLKTHT